MKLIWFIDTDKNIGGTVRTLIQKDGQDYLLKDIDDPAEIGARLNEESPDLIFITLETAHAGEENTFALLKAHEKSKNVPIVIMAPEISIKEKAADAGADGFLAKPFTIDEFLTAANAHLK